MISRMIEGDFLSWVFLASAIVLEIAGTTCTKLSEGLTRVGPSALMLVCYSGASILIALAVQRLEISTIYAIWCGLGITAISLIGIFIFHESSSPFKLIGIALVLTGTVILQMSDSPTEADGLMSVTAPMADTLPVSGGSPVPDK